MNYLLTVMIYVVSCSLQLSIVLVILPLSLSSSSFIWYKNHEVSSAHKHEKMYWSCQRSGLQYSELYILSNSKSVQCVYTSITGTGIVFIINYIGNVLLCMAWLLYLHWEWSFTDLDGHGSWSLISAAAHAKHFECTSSQKSVQYKYTYQWR